MARALKLFAVGLLTLGMVAGCASRRELHSSQDRKMTVGTVQKEIRVGMSSIDVAAALGQPNQVRYHDGQEAWIYDKIATAASYVSTNSNVGAGIGAGGATGDVLLLGTISGGHNKKKGYSATTQKTLTVIIRFDENDAVKAFSYHSSTF